MSHTASYHTSVTFSSEGDGYDEDFTDLQSAVDFINYWANGRPHTRAWINNVLIRIQNCVAIGDDGKPLCTNQAWHDLFATKSYPRVPTNPQTYADRGEAL
jgi:hypothetical protein